MLAIKDVVAYNVKKDMIIRITKLVDNLYTVDKGDLNYSHLTTLKDIISAVDNGTIIILGKF